MIKFSKKDMIFMNRLKDIREDNEKLQSEIAKYLGISQQYYSRYELNEIDMPIRHYKKLAVLYNVSIDYLCGLTNSPRTISGEKYTVKNTAKNITNINGGNVKINIKN